MRALLASLAFGSVALVLVGCPGEAASPTVTVGDGGGGTTVEPVEAGAAVAPSDAGPKLCGCALCEPVSSADPCKTADDCAPATPCHATACVAKAKAEPRSPNLACTEIFQCNAIEANSCACVGGKCAIAPRPTK
jgi:hypothetical protein